MFKLTIEDDEGKTTVVPLSREEVTIGRLDGNTIRLTERNVSRKHARLVRQNGAIYIEDLASFTGVRVNGTKIEFVLESAATECEFVVDGTLETQVSLAASITPSTGPPGTLNFHLGLPSAVRQ